MTRLEPLYVFVTVGGTTRRMAEWFFADAETIVLTAHSPASAIPNPPPPLPHREFVLVYPSYGAKPPALAIELIRSPLCIGVVVCGNRTFGRGFCASARRVRSVPVLATVELSGSAEEARSIRLAASSLLS